MAMRAVLCLFLFSLLSISAFAQSDSIIATKVFAGYKFEHNGTILNPRALLKIMEADPEAYALMKKARTSSDIGTVFAFTGGFLIGWPIGTAIAGGDPNWLLAGIGAGCLAIGIPLSLRASKGIIGSVNLYNSNLRGTYFEQGLRLRLGVATGGVGVTVDF